MAKKAGKAVMEEEIKTLQKHVGGLVKTILSMKSQIEVLEKKVESKNMGEVEKIMEEKEVVDKAIAANREAIQCMDNEIKEILKKETKNSVQLDTQESHLINVDATVEKIAKSKSDKVCGHNNGGYCKYRSKCRYYHSKEICEEYSSTGKCSLKECRERHPRKCKWMEGTSKCRRTTCDYFHATFASDDEILKCVSCHDVWEDRNCVVKHMIKHEAAFFCLNCDDWIKDKSKVFDQGWTLMDQEGFLRQGI